jgi:hypothetical protein
MERVEATEPIATFGDEPELPTSPSPDEVRKLYADLRTHGSLAVGDAFDDFQNAVRSFQGHAFVVATLRARSPLRSLAQRTMRPPADNGSTEAKTPWRMGRARGDRGGGSLLRRDLAATDSHRAPARSMRQRCGRPFVSQFRPRLRPAEPKRLAISPGLYSWANGS